MSSLESVQMPATDCCDMICGNSQQGRIVRMAAFFVRIVTAGVVAADESPAWIFTHVLI